MISTGEPHEGGDEEVIEYPQAVSVEVLISLRADSVAAAHEGGASSRGTGSGSSVTLQGDKRRFVKNFVRGHFQNATRTGNNGLVRSPQVIISLQQMQSLLPKESEREIQVCSPLLKLVCDS
jgi:hypothetical protein